MSRAIRNGRARVAVATATAAVRCAIYTRKSTDEGLERDFNSLDNQREAAEAFIASQRGEGWTTLSDRYEDGGFSGANMERPALKRLVADIEAGKLDCVVVYKLDRLSRSVRDYLNFLAYLEMHGVDFVSVTQQFNTATPLGRMTLKQLLLFAEFERDLIAERTRDKMHAARKRGKWTGGMPPLGYDIAPEGGRLVVNREEAEQVRVIFELHVEKQSLVAVAQELNRRGWGRKSWTTREGKPRQGRPWDRVTLHRLLTDPLYAGLQKLGDETFPGEQPAIVPRGLFEKVQRLMAENRRTRGAEHRNRHGALLRGLLTCAACGTAMAHAPVKKDGRLYRYYRCLSSMRNGASSCPSRSISANRVEAFVVDRIRCIGRDPVLREETFRQALAQVAAQRRGLKAEAKRLAKQILEAQAGIERLVAAVTATPGKAAEALTTALNQAQERVATLGARLREIRAEEVALAAQEVNEGDLARTLETFDPIWDVLLTPEKERILKLLLERVSYDGSTGRLEIGWRLAGMGDFAREVDGG